MGQAKSEFDLRIREVTGRSGAERTCAGVGSVFRTLGSYLDN